MLSNEEVNELFEKIKRNDRQARELLAEESLGLVKYLINKKFKSYYDKDELVSVGNIGLVKAINTFDNTKEVAFKTYALKIIENEILMYLKKINNKDTVSLDANIMGKDSDDTVALQDLLKDDFDMVDEYCNREVSNEVFMIVDKLPEPKREIIKFYYGFYGKRYTLKEIAKQYSYSSENVSRIILSTIERIGEELEKNGLIELKENKTKKKKGYLNIYETLNNYRIREIDEAMEILSEEERKKISFYHHTPISKLSSEEENKFNYIVFKVRKKLKQSENIKLIRKK